MASSSSKERAEHFINETGIPGPCAAYGSYEELVADPNVDIIYVATPHSHHFQNTMLALEAGKHVLCEKPFTVNAEQLEVLRDVARQKKLFLMEAVWTRYFPVSVQIRDLIRRGEIGEVLRVTADNSVGANPEEDWGDNHRMVNLDLAGGALLDCRLSLRTSLYEFLLMGRKKKVGIYSLTWVFQTLYHTLPVDQRRPPSAISSYVAKYPGTGADEDTTVLLTFPTTTPTNNFKPNRTSHAVASTSLRLASNPDRRKTAGPAIRIQGTKGEIQVHGPAYRPEGFRLIPLVPKGADPNSVEIKEVENPFPDNGHGMYWEADEAARCLRDGKLESETMPLEESIQLMRVMDEVRKQAGLVYPEKIESRSYPLNL